MAFQRQAGQSLITTKKTGTAPTGYLAVYFKPTTTITINAVRIYRQTGSAIPGDVGFATTLGSGVGTIGWTSCRNSAASFANDGWNTISLPSITLTAGTYYILLFGCPAGGDAYAVLGSGATVGTYTGIATDAALYEATSNTGNWGGPTQLQMPGFDLGTGTDSPALTATPNPATMAVDLTVTGATGTIGVTRYVAGQSPVGTPVRGSFANGRVVPDRDAPLNTELVYIAADTVGQSPQVTVTLASVTAVLTVMSSTALQASLIVLADDAQTYEGQSTAHLILGTNTPLVTVQPPAYRAGTYRFLLPTINDWLALRAILMTGAVMLLRSPCQTEFLDTAFIMTSGRNSMPWNAAAPRHRIFELDYQATAPDSTPPTDIAWSWADVGVQFATWADLPLAIATWADVQTYVPPPAMGL